MSDHAVLSASSGHRWSVCPISVTGTAESVSKAAAEGTVCHAIADELLSGKPAPEIGSVRSADGFDFKITDDMLNDVRAYVEYVQGLPWEGRYYVENRVSYGRALGVPFMTAWGTSDCWGFVKTPTGRALKIIDLKMGRRAVGCERNKQMALYGAGALDRMAELPLPLDFPVELTIFQPRISRRPSVWVTTVGWIEETTTQMRAAAKAAIAYSDGTATPQTMQDFPEMPGEHCTFCRRQGDCSAFKRQAASIGVEGKTVAWDYGIFSMRHAIRDYLDELEQYALDEGQRGNLLPGTKLVRGRAGKAELLMEQSKVREQARALGIEAKVVRTEEVWATPAKIRDAFKAMGMSAADLAKIIHQPEGAIQLADINDPRPAIETTNGHQFTAQEVVL